MRIHLFLMIASGVFLAGCAQPGQNINQQNFRQDRYLVSHVKVPGSFAEIQQALFKHRDHCSIYFDFSLDPQQVHFATIHYGFDSAMENSIIADLTTFASGKVEMKTYAYYARNKPLAQSLLTAVSSPETCPMAPNES